MRIGDLVLDNPGFLSMEFFPPRNEEEWPKFFDVAEKLAEVDPLFVSVTYGAGGSTHRNTLKVCKTLKEDFGLEPMPHFTAIGADKGKVNRFVGEMQDIGLENILALRGDRPRWMDDGNAGQTEFAYASDLTRYIAEQVPEMNIGVAGYPEAHPQSPSITSDIQVMRNKVAAGGAFIVTQLFFDNRVYFDYVDRLRAAGVTAPVLPGILPIRSLASLKRIMSLCDARIPGKLFHRMEAAHESGGIEAVRRAGLDFALEQITGLLQGGAPGIHLYTLNMPGMCREIADCVRSFRKAQEGGSETATWAEPMNRVREGEAALV